jgi:hypothetical protein
MILPRDRWTRQRAKPGQYHILSFDPGGTIGWAHFVFDYQAFSRPENKLLRWLLSWNCGEYAGTELEQLDLATAATWNCHFPNEYNSRLDVIAEDFELTQLIGGKNLLSPVRINAVIDWECRKHGLALQLQKRQMRTAVTPERLNLYGFEGRWTTTGRGKDAFAAMQHAVVWARRIKEKSKAQPWKLCDGQVGRYWDCACSDGELCDMSHAK